MIIEEIDENLEFENNEIIEDISRFDPSEIVVYSREWTIETVLSQVRAGNIDLNPKYQRRNAWNDDKRSKLIESILIGYPVPEIVLAEDQDKKRSFAVIDGKQRLMTIAGFVSPEIFKYWDRPKLSALKVRSDLSGMSFDDFLHSDKEALLREFHNSAIRCTVITNYNTNDVLYDIFYRLNSGSVALATQELRQVLNRGEFADYLIETTNHLQLIHSVMGLPGPDKRLRDIEVLLRCLAMLIMPETYNGNLKVFLDESMRLITVQWTTYQTIISVAYEQINDAILMLVRIFGGYNKVGRKYTKGQAEGRFNRVVLEVQLFFFTKLNPDAITESSSDKFLRGFIHLSQDDAEFRSSVESSTKSLDSYRIRFTKFQDLVNDAFGVAIDANPFR